MMNKLHFELRCILATLHKPEVRDIMRLEIEAGYGTRLWLIRARIHAQQADKN